MLALVLLVLVPLVATSALGETEAASSVEIKLKVKTSVGDTLVEEPVQGDEVIAVVLIHNNGDSPKTVTITLYDAITQENLATWENRTVEGKKVGTFTYTWKPAKEEYELHANVSGEFIDVATKDFKMGTPPAESPLIIMVPIAGILGIVFAAIMAKWVLSQETGPKEMTDISDAIKEGAEAFLSTQYKTIWMIALPVSMLFLVAIGASSTWLNGIKTAVAFLIGAACSSVAGYIGMFVSIRANIRTASAARSSLNLALKIALRGGAVSGFSVVAMSLIGVTAIYYGYGMGGDPRMTPLMIVGFGFGASFVALFAQLGGGIYTKAADVGADLVGKVEKDIPEDDPRNAAVIADLVGDNVGDCAGRGADLFESTAAENIGAMVLGVALYPILGINGIMFPLVARAFGLIATIVGVLVVSTKEDGDPMQALNRGYIVTTLLAAVGFGIATMMMLNSVWYFGAGLVGILISWGFVYITQYYTEVKYRPVQEIAKASETGPATNIIQGIAVGMECTAIPVLVVSIGLFTAFKFGELGAADLGIGALVGGFYGTAVATMGMLSVCAYILAMDTFGPIADNAGGISEMSQQPEKVRQKMDRLDAVGNTTKALTKGYAVGSAALAAFLLFSAYLEAAHLTHVQLDKVDVFIGAMMGGMLVFVFSSFAIRAVGKAAFAVITEVRRQFKEHPGIMTYKEKPDYGQCVSIVTKSALREMIIPGVLAVVVPIVVGLVLRAEALGATLMVGTITGLLLGLMLNNGGGAWDNAKKSIEEFGKIKAKALVNDPTILAELKRRSPDIFADIMKKAKGLVAAAKDEKDEKLKAALENTIVYGKTSDPHKAAVVGDTVGDPFKDTAGPSLHVLIKLLSTITLVLAPLFV